MPLGPSVVFTRSAIAIAPMKAACTCMMFAFRHMLGIVLCTQIDARSIFHDSTRRGSAAAHHPGSFALLLCCSSLQDLLRSLQGKPLVSHRISETHQDTPRTTIRSC